MRTYKDIVYDSCFPETCKLDLYLPEETTTAPAYLYIHGGGLEAGDKNGVGKMAQHLTGCGIALISIDYRMYPYCRYSDFLNDAAAAAAWALHKSKTYFEITHLVIGGTSAGGYISMMLYFNPGFLANCGVSLHEIKGWFFDAGQPTAHFNVLKYEQGLDSRCVRIDATAPLYYLNTAYTEPEKQPHIFICCSSNDMVNRREQLQVLYTAMLHFSFPPEKLTFKVYESAGHGAYCDWDTYYEDLTGFVKTAMSQ